MNPSFPPGIGLRTFANSPETNRIRFSLDGSVRFAPFGALDCCAPPDCGAGSVRNDGRKEMLSPEGKFPVELRSDDGKRGIFGKSAAANEKSSNDIGSQLDITNRAPPCPGTRLFYDAPGRLSSGSVQNYWETTVTPWRSIRMGKSSPPQATTEFSTRSRASGSINSTRHPPPPAPQTFPASAPFRRAPLIIASIVFVEMVGRLRRRKVHSACITRPGSSLLRWSDRAPRKWPQPSRWSHRCLRPREPPK